MTTISIDEASKHLAQIVEQATTSDEPVVLTSNGKATAVLLRLETYEALIAANKWLRQPTLPWSKLQVEFRQAVAESGYTSRERILQLVRETKQEAAAEHAQSRDADNY